MLYIMKMPLLRETHALYIWLQSALKMKAYKLWLIITRSKQIDSVISFSYSSEFFYSGKNHLLKKI